MLVALRAAHRHQGGRWEFPGGKLDAGESVEEALARELREELGIEVEAAEPLLVVHHDYADRRVLLDVWRVTRWCGEPQGREGQPLRWLAPAALDEADFPAANAPIVAALRYPRANHPQAGSQDMGSNSEIIDRFSAAWAAKDVDAIMDYFLEDAVYTNMPIEPANIGKPAIRAVIEMFLGMAQQVEFVVHNTAENPLTGVVMNERTDRFLLANGTWLELPVMGVFELRDGRIAAWRDYFDMAVWTRAMGG